jgi:hypothetical protein
MNCTASVYVRDGDKRKAIFHAQADVVDQKFGPVWGSSIHVKHGDAWKWTFVINLPARG